MNEIVESKSTPKLDIVEEKEITMLPIRKVGENEMEKYSIM